MKKDYLDQEKIERTDIIQKNSSLKTNKELTELCLKSEVALLVHTFEKVIKESNDQYGVGMLHCVSLPDYTWECGLKNIGVRLQTLQDKDTLLLVNFIIRAGISEVMGDRYVKPNAIKKMLFVDANDRYGRSIIQLSHVVELDLL